MKYLKYITTVGLLLIFSCEVSEHYTDLETKENFVKFNDDLEFQVNLYKDPDMFNEGESYCNPPYFRSAYLTTN